MGGRRPPTIRCRRSSQGSLAYQQEQETLPAAAIPLTNGTESARSRGRSKTPQPRPPPPVFRQPEPVTTPLFELRPIGHSAVASGKRRFGFRHGSSVFFFFFRLANSIGFRNDGRGGSRAETDHHHIRPANGCAVRRIVEHHQRHISLHSGMVDNSSQPVGETEHARRGQLGAAGRIRRTSHDFSGQRFQRPSYHRTTTTVGSHSTGTIAFGRRRQDSTSSAIEKMIPSWIKNPSPVSSGSSRKKRRVNRELDCPDCPTLASRWKTFRILDRKKRKKKKSRLSKIRRSHRSSGRLPLPTC